MSKSKQTWQVTFTLKTGGRVSGGTIEAPRWWNQTKVEAHAILNSGRRMQIKFADAELVDAVPHGDFEDDISAALEAHMCPDAVAVIASILQIASNYEKPGQRAIFQQVNAFREVCERVAAEGQSEIARVGL